MKRRIEAWASLALMFLISGCSGGGSDSQQPAPQPPATNTPPTANAGPDQVVNPGVQVDLNGSGSSDSNGSIATYAWAQTSGTTVTLSGANTATAAFMAPASAGAIGLQLTVTDNGGASHSDTVTVTVNAPPSADAGADQTVQAGAAVSLAGSGVDSDGAIASYTWTQTGGEAVVLSGSNTATLSFTAPGVAANLSFQLTVIDDHGASHSDTAIITVVSPPTAPVIVRQPTSPKAFEYGSALLFVVASGHELSYEWRSGGGNVIKSGPEPWLMRTGLALSDDGNCYSVIVTNSLGSVTSEDGCLTVLELDVELDPYNDEEEGLGADDAEYASAFANTLMAAAQLATGGLTGPSLAFFGSTGVITGVPFMGRPNYSCYSGTHVGATLDAAPVTTAVFTPIGKHSVSEIWNECREHSDALYVSDGGILVEYDFPERYGEGSFAIYLSGYRYGDALFNGILRATVAAQGVGTSDRWDDIEIVVEDDFSSKALNVSSAFEQSISIRRRYSNDLARMDDTTLDFDVSMWAYDRDGSAGSIFQSGGANTRLRWVEPGDGGEPPHFSNEKFAVGLTGGFHLATLQAEYGLMGWAFDVLPAEDCPEGYICVDPPDGP